MNIVKSYAEIIVPTGRSEREYWLELLEHAEESARVSHRSEDRRTQGSAEKLLKFIVMEKGDFSVIEHASVSVESYTDRGITHEWVRHRLFSFTQESTRFVNYKKKMPPSFIAPQFDTTEQQDAWERGIRNAEASYKELLSLGLSPQIARDVLPNALGAKMVTTGNMRNWRHFLLMRTSKETHPKFRQVTIPLLQEFKALPYWGWLFEDIEPEGKQSENMKKMR